MTVLAGWGTTMRAIALLLAMALSLAVAQIAWHLIDQVAHSLGLVAGLG